MFVNLFVGEADQGYLAFLLGDGSDLLGLLVKLWIELLQFGLVMFLLLFELVSELFEFLIVKLVLLADEGLEEAKHWPDELLEDEALFSGFDVAQADEFFHWAHIYGEDWIGQLLLWLRCWRIGCYPY